MRLLLTCLVLILASTQIGSAQTALNVVVIVADDLGYNDLGSYGSPDALTPNIDRLAAEGVRFTDFYVNPACSPTRFSLLTGRYVNRSRDRIFNPIRHFVNDEGLRSADGETVVDVFAARGYDTAIIGKWHLGHGGMICCNESDNEFHPLNHGFNHFYGLLGGMIDYNLHIQPRSDDVVDWFSGRQKVIEEGYSTDLLSDAAVTYIRDRSSGGKPFFLYLPYNAVHSAYPRPAPPEDLLQLPQGREREYLSRFDHLYGNDSNIRKRYLAVLSVLDDGIGRVLDELERTALASNTLVIFMSDNGGARSYGSSNFPLKGGKFDLWEGGIRVPAIFRLPGVIGSGTVSPQVWHAVDLLPTLLALAGHPPIPSDGVDLSTHLKGAASIARDIFYADPKRGNVYRQGRWKYFAMPKGEEYLFDLDADVGETKNLSTTHPAVLTRLKNLHAEQLDRVKAPLPPPSVTRTSVADAFVRGGKYANMNFGKAPALLLRKGVADGNVTTESYLKFDLSELSGTIQKATIRLLPFDVAGSHEHAMALVPDDSWGEQTITWNNKPLSSQVLGTWKVTEGQLAVIDVTRQAQEAHSTDRRLSLRIYKPQTDKEALARYGSRENSTPEWRPEIVIDFGAADLATLGTQSHPHEGTDLISTSVSTEIKQEYRLEQSYPNPFNATTRIRFHIPEDAHVTLDVFDVLGRKVTTLTDGRTQAGTHEFEWDGRSESGVDVGSGIYFYRLKAGHFIGYASATLQK